MIKMKTRKYYWSKLNFNANFGGTNLRVVNDDYSQTNLLAIIDTDDSNELVSLSFEEIQEMSKGNKDINKLMEMFLIYYRHEFGYGTPMLYKQLELLRTHYPKLYAIHHDMTGNMEVCVYQDEVDNLDEVFETLKEEYYQDMLSFLKEFGRPLGEDGKLDLDTDGYYYFECEQDDWKMFGLTEMIDGLDIDSLMEETMNFPINRHYLGLK